MDSFQYVDKNGKLQTVRASNQSEAQNKATNIASNSGFMRVPATTLGATPNTPTPIQTPDVASQIGVNVSRLGSLDAKALENTPQFTPALTPTQEKQDTLVDRGIKALEKTLGKSLFIQEQQKDLNYEGNIAALNDINKKIADEQRSLDLATRDLEGKGRTTRANSATSRELTNQSYRRQADLALVKAGIQGDITTANDLIANRVALEFGDAEAELNAVKEQLALLEPTLNREEKRQADQTQLFLEERSRLLDDQKTKASQAYQVAIKTAESNPGLAQTMIAQINAGQYDAVISQGIGAGAFVPSGKNGMSSREQDYYDDLSYYVEQNTDPAQIERILGLKYPEYRSRISSDLNVGLASTIPGADSINSVASDYFVPETSIGTLKPGGRVARENIFNSAFRGIGDQINNIFR